MKTVNRSKSMRVGTTVVPTPDHGRIEMGATPKAGLRSGARPRGEEFPGKNHEAASIP
jgi:hypothetical protein